MEKLRDIGDSLYVFHCPGCKCGHFVRVENPGGLRPVWEWNKSLDYPTFHPSIRVRSGTDDKPEVCHSFVRDGKIQFLSDCTHELAGQTVEIPDWES